MYRGSNLIAVVGEGGDVGTSGDGVGGGINIPGSDGGGRLGGNGGQRINTGTLSLSGSYGSIYENAGLTLYPGDEVVTANLMVVELSVVRKVSIGLIKVSLPVVTMDLISNL